MTKREGLECKSCETSFDTDERGLIEVREWLFITPTCERCRASFCTDCVTTCFSCHNDSEYHPSLCLACAETRDVERCGGCHEAYNCARHQNRDSEVRCGICHANRNYSRKYGL